MRAIKFRGKGIADNEWYFGDLIQSRLGTAWIITENYTTATEDITVNTCASPQIKQDTVGQFTGLKDKNGKEIYEGDILTYKEEVIEYEGGSRPYSYLDLFEGTVEYSNGCFWVNDRPLYKLLEFEEEINIEQIKNIEVIGNIYDNKDLLEKGKEE